MSLSLENKVKKLAEHYKRPPRAEFLNELTLALAKVDERAVSDAFNKIWRNHKTFPSMAEITRLVNSEALKYKKKHVALQNKSHCVECDNLGYFMVVNPSRGHTAIASCACHKGIEIRTSKGYLRFDDCAAKGYTKRFKEWQENKRK